MEPAAQKYMAYTITPEGSGAVKGFNAGACCPLVTRDDVQFTREMHQWAVTNLCIDLRRVYSTGFSNGGFMSHRLACQASDIIKGIAPHSGTLGFGGSFTSCQNPIAQPVLAFHGTEDPTVPYNGGSWPGFETSFNGWKTANNCPGDPHRVADRSPTTFCWEYDRCTKGGVTAPVMFCTIRNLAHKWSGGNEGSGANPNDIDATDYMWQFFNGLSDIPQPTLIN
jgi:polyhydroxybutyrate depolymerase